MRGERDGDLSRGEQSVIRSRFGRGVGSARHFCAATVERLLARGDQVAAPDPAWSSDRPYVGTSDAPYRVCIIGHNDAVELERSISVLKERLGRKPERNLLPLQPGNVPNTFADVSDLVDGIGYRPGTPVEEGIRKFGDRYRGYYQV